MEELKKLLMKAKESQNDNSSSKIVDGVTTCCGYDFGTDADVAKFCPICGKRLQ